MSKLTWEDIRDSVNALSHKFTKKADSLVDIAAIRIRLTALNGNLEEEYIALGKMTHEGMTSEVPNEETVAARIRASVDRITQIRSEIDALEDKISHKKHQENE